MSTYSPGFYDTIRPGVQSSAAVVVPLVVEHLRPQRVVDVGCGEGWWARAFADRGCEALGVDGGYVDTSATGIQFVVHDLARSLPAVGQFDLAVALEVAEHLPASRADTFVADLCALAPVVLFSAAIPGQGGAGHVNEAWPAYWAAKFNTHGFAVSGALRWQIWDDDRVDNWYRQNLLVAAREPQQFPTLFDTPLAPPWPVVHPVLFEARRRG